MGSQDHQRRFTYNLSSLGIIPNEYFGEQDSTTSPRQSTDAASTSRQSTTPRQSVTPRQSAVPRQSSIVQRSSLPQFEPMVAPSTSTPRKSCISSKSAPINNQDSISSSQLLNNIESFSESARKFILTAESMDLHTIQPRHSLQDSFCNSDDIAQDSGRNTPIDSQNTDFCPCPSHRINFASPPCCSRSNSMDSPLRDPCGVSPIDNFSLNISENVDGNNTNAVELASCTAPTNQASDCSMTSPVQFIKQLCTRMVPMPIEYYQKHLEVYKQEAAISGVDAHKINSQLNEMFIKRLAEIDSKTDKGCEMKLVTYQEWVEMLLKINDIIINNMQELEAEVAQRLDMFKCKAKTQTDTGVAKYQNDINMLLKLIHNGYFDDNWNMDCLHFETLTPDQVLGACENQSPRSDETRSQRSRLTSDTLPRNKENEEQLSVNTKALAIEVAHKHDIICELKKQIVCLEDEIQNAQKKIQLKDDVIRELRSDLKCANAKNQLTKTLIDASVSADMPPINTEIKSKEILRCLNPPEHRVLEAPCRYMLTEAKLIESNRSSTTNATVVQEMVRNVTTVNECDCNDSLMSEEVIRCEDLCGSDRNEEDDKLKELHDELSELFDMAKDIKKQNLEYHRHRLSEIFKKSEAEKHDAYRKLDCIRRLLVDLEAKVSDPCAFGNWSDCDSGFSSKCEKDQDSRIIDSLRRRLNGLNENAFTLKKRVQELEIENNEVVTKWKTETCFSRRNSRVLREIADLLTNITGTPFLYKEIYTTDVVDENPFCDAIAQLRTNFKKQEDLFIRNMMEMNDKIEKLEDTICINKQQQDDALKYQVHQLTATICEKEAHIERLTHMVDQLKDMHKVELAEKQCARDRDVRELRDKLSEANNKIEGLLNDITRFESRERFLKCESRKINNELETSKDKNRVLEVQQQRLASLLNTQEAHRMDLVKKYESLEGNYDIQAQKLCELQTELARVQERLAKMNIAHEEHIADRKRLQNELMACKSREAEILCKHKALQLQFMKADEEVRKAHQVIRQQQKIMQRNEASHRDMIKNLQASGDGMRLQFKRICEDYRRLQDQYEKQVDLDKQNEKVLDSFRKWKEAQLKADEATRITFKQYEENIRLLLEEKESFLEQYRSLHRDYSVLQSELERIKRCALR